MHAGLLAATLVVFSNAEKFKDAQEAIPVEMISDQQFNQIMKGEKTAKEIKIAPRVEKRADVSEAKPLPQLGEAKRDVPAPPPSLKGPPAEDDDRPEPVRPKRVAALPPAPPAKPSTKAAPEPEENAPDEAEAVRPKPPNKPKPKEEPRLKIDEVAKLLEEKKRNEQPSLEAPKKKSEKTPAKPKSGDETAPKSKFSAASIASLLSHEAPQRRAATGAEVTRTASLGSLTANASRMSPSLQAQIDGYTVEHYRKCWQAALSMNARGYVPRVEFLLTREGALEGPPRLLNPSVDPVERSRGEQALGAVRRCSPMPIPAAFTPYYDYWRVTELDMREDM